jgi:hypothetical protein
MKYTNKNTSSKIKRMKQLKKSMKKMSDIADRNSIDPESGLNTRLQKSGMGERANSHAKKVGSIINKNTEKVFDNIEKMHDPERREKELKKKLKRMKKFSENKD